MTALAKKKPLAPLDDPDNPSESFIVRQKRGLIQLTPQKQDKFLERYAETGIVTIAARSIGVSRQAIYELRKRDKAFARRYKAAKREALDLMEAELNRRGFMGYEEPVWYKGAQVGTQRKYSDTAAIVRLKAELPEKYREKYDINQKNLNLNATPDDLTDEQLAEIVRKSLETKDNP